ncbi:hypothetical protein CEXT_574521 [Caerostris extrusa]|uniref:Uncharacterized protein n=1 Tax=Caerostris extrusa TaxID=172846 RepID=A0AAV4TFW2_CAEEX|nr:hypothetical protein CEXT_574521 [Caerostris extrusa]
MIKLMPTAQEFFGKGKKKKSKIIVDLNFHSLPKSNALHTYKLRKRKREGKLLNSRRRFLIWNCKSLIEYSIKSEKRIRRRSLSLTLLFCLVEKTLNIVCFPF